MTVTRAGVLVGGAALLVILLWRIGPVEVLGIVSRVRWYFATMLAFGTGHQMMRALALRACVVRRAAVRFRDALAIRLSGEAVQSLTFTGPVLAEPTKAWLLEARGLTLMQGFAATLTEYLVYTFVGAAMAIAGVLYITSHFEPTPTLTKMAWAVVALCVIFLVVSALAIARRFYLIGVIISALARAGVLRGRLAPDMTWIHRMEDLLLQVLRDSPAVCARVAAFEAAAQGLLVLELIVLFHALDVMSGRWSAFAIESSVKVFEFAFVFVPLQLGVSEGAYAALFRVTALPLAAGFAIAFLRRARSLIIASVGVALLATQTGGRARQE